MKKILLGTTALVAASMVAAPGAQAAEPVKLGLGGWMVQALAYGSQDDDWETANGTEYNNFDQIQRSEVNFSGETKLDNGIGVRVDIELESDSGPNGGGGNDNFGIDESYLSLTSASMGTVNIGKFKGVGHTMRHVAPNVTGVTRDAGDVQTNTVVQSPGAVAVLGNTSINDVADINRLTYVSPTFMGFSAGVTWTPDAIAAGTAGQPSNSSQYSVMLAYNETLGGVDVGADVGYANGGTLTTTSSDAWDAYRAGLNLGYAGFTVGGGWSVQDVRTPSNALVDEGTVADGQKWNIGASYSTGPYAVSITYDVAEGTGTWANTTDDEQTNLIFGGNYTLGPGVSLLGSVFSVDYDDETSANANNNDGWGAVAGMSVSF